MQILFNACLSLFGRNRAVVEKLKNIKDIIENIHNPGVLLEFNIWTEQGSIIKNIKDLKLIIVLPIVYSDGTGQ